MAKLAAAIVLAIVTMTSAEIPRNSDHARVAREAPYQPSGWRPSGPKFNLPVRSQPQQTYGPPQDTYGPPPQATTTEEPEATTTLAPDVENFPPRQPPQQKAKPANVKQDTDAEQVENVNTNQPEAGPYYVILPQGGQNVVYAVQSTVPQRTAAFLAVPRTEARLEVIPAFSSVSASSVYTPFSASYIQIYQ